MYPVNCGSNCPSMGIDIARNTRGSTSTGPGPISLQGDGLRSSKRFVFSFMSLLVPIVSEFLFRVRSGHTQAERSGADAFDGQFGRACIGSHDHNTSVGKRVYLCVQPLRVLLRTANMRDCLLYTSPSPRD